ncbi:MAG: alpha-L-fucosidase [Bacteroidales bacterium]|nr:alpha-L-fucosidase [Bacteroidales bacterium]
MIYRTVIQSLLAIVLALLLGCKPQPYGPVPSEAQLRWQEMEYNMFVHFGPNTFTGLEWGQGNEAEDIFHPTALDCRQWAATAKAAGMKGIIITAKHHDGFCLWPNPESLHTVARSSWRGGQGDVLKDLSEACREYGLKFGVYISPWDRNDPAYGSPAYNEKYIRTLQSVHDGRYGPVFEQWFDGACGEGPNGKRQEYDWPAFHEAVWALSPDAILFSDVGPGCRWMGNERGVAGETNWSRLDVAGFTPGAGAPPRDTLARGNVFGKQWIPGEIDVSIRPGWFWRESENAQVKSVEQLADIWLTSVGRNALLLLNVPPDTRGRIHEIDSTRLMEFRAWREKVLGVNLAADAGIRKRARGSIWEMTLPEARTVNYVQLQEEIALGQRISGFRVEVENADGWRTIAEGTTIGYKRILPVATVTARKVRVTITASLARPVLKDIALY